MDDNHSPLNFLQIYPRTQFSETACHHDNSLSTVIKTLIYIPRQDLLYGLVIWEALVIFLSLSYLERHLI